MTPSLRRLLASVPTDVDEWLQNIDYRWETATSKKRKKVNGEWETTEYAENIATFDTETTSFRAGDRPLGLVYVWMLDVCDCVIYGRTIPEFLETLAALDDHLNLTEDGITLPIFVHNLSFDFAFIYRYFEWGNVFAMSTHDPVRARTGCWEFRDSLVLFGTALANVKLHDHQAHKLVGDLDYTKIRTPKTPLTDEEWGYCYQDVNVLSLAIREKLNDNGDSMATMPMTRTGYVRRSVRKRMQADEKAMFITQTLTMTPATYDLLKKIFAGGHTHAGNYNTKITHECVESRDFASSYPAVIMSEKFPMENFQEEDPAEFAYYMDHAEDWAMAFKIEFTGLREKFIYDHPISESHCEELRGASVDNGRIVCAAHLVTYCTETDWETMVKAYSWEDAAVHVLYVARKHYLPKPIVEYMAECYAKKTELKGDKTQLIYYNLAKEICNGQFGMMVTDPVKDEVTFNPENEKVWDTAPVDLAEALDRYNTSPNRFLFYAWGVWVTSYARRNLWLGIFEFGPDFLYADTDSIKGHMTPEHKKFIDDYNQKITAKVHACLDFHGIDRNLSNPEIKNGERKGEHCPIGVWDFDGYYEKFKTLGAKRYMYQDGSHDGIHCTVAGLGKKAEYTGGDDNRPLRLPDYLKTVSPEDPFAAFDDGLTVPEEYTGKLTHTYFDTPADGVLVDFQGTPYDYHVESGVNLAGQQYDMKMKGEFLAFLESRQSTPLAHISLLTVD